MSNITRVKKGEIINSGRVLVTCTVTIIGLWSHSGTGEEWADDDNSVTAADSQAFKRACSCFGLGRSFYDISVIWVDLDEKRQPVRTPVLAAGLCRRTGAGECGRQAGKETVALMDPNTQMVPTALPTASLVRPPQARPVRKMGRTVTHNQTALTGRLRKARAPTSTLAFGHWRRQGRGSVSQQSARLWESQSAKADPGCGRQAKGPADTGICCTWT